MPDSFNILFLQWKCWSLGIDTRWKSKSCSNISGLYAFLFCIGYVIPVCLFRTEQGFQVDLIVLFFTTREIWSSFCFYSIAHFCGSVLYLLWLCWYVSHVLQCPSIPCSKYHSLFSLPCWGLFLCCLVGMLVRILNFSLLLRG